MLGGEDLLEVMRVNASVAATSFFKVDILMVSKSVEFSPQVSGAKLNNYVESIQILRPADLMTDQELHGGEIL